MIFFIFFRYKFKFVIPGRPNNSKLSMDLPISSAMPQEKPVAFEALFAAVSISFKVFIISLESYRPKYH